MYTNSFVNRSIAGCIGAMLSVFGFLIPVPASGAKPGGVAARLPTFVPVTPPVKTLQPVSPFNIVGFIQKATLDNSSDVSSGGTITVNGITIVVPRNTIFQLPAFALTWYELFKLAPSGSAPALSCTGNGLPCSTGPYGLNTPSGPQTGLALGDTPAPAATYEVTVIGNRVVSGSTDQYIAALIFMSQQSLNSGQGYINFIDYAKGELWVSSTMNGPTGTRVRMNTPVGRYGLSQTPDQRFTADEDNPTIRTDTGYPMCIPRFDPGVATDSLCPQWNRPVDPVTGGYQTVYTMPPPPAVPPTPVAGGPTPPPDATQQAPFELNDYITFSGTLVNDPSGSQYISAHTIVASLGIFTAPGTLPVYVAIEDMRLGVAGTPNPLFPQEAVEKLVVTAVTTDSSQLVDFYAIDVDACGAQKSRFYGSADPFGPPVGGKKGRARLRTTVGNFLPATREMRAASRAFIMGQSVDAVLPRAQTYANGLVAGQYHAPNFEFIFPENLVAGSPQVPLPLQEFPFLVGGSGPYFGAGTNASATKIGDIGQLSPWPGSAAPAPGACGSAGTVLTNPNANAGAPQTVNAGVTVSLDGSASTDTNTPALPLSYVWVQASGPSVVLQDPQLSKPYFTAPALPQGSTSAVLTFQLVVSNGFASSGVATTTITVSGPRAPVVNAGPDQSANGGAQVHLTGSATDPNGAAAQPLKYQWSQTAGTAVVLDNPVSASPSFVAPVMAPGQAAMALSFRLGVTNALGSSASATTNVTVKPLNDTVTITAATYKTSGSRLAVTARSSVTNGVPVLTLHVPGKSDVVMTYDPTTQTYSVPQYIVNPIPGSVSVTSSFGGSATSTLTRIN
jgi:hypothetical protein